MKVYRHKQEELLRVEADKMSGTIHLITPLIMARRQRHGDDFYVELSRKEVTALISALKTQRKKRFVK